MKYFHKTVTRPPPYCIYEILIQIFDRKFRDKIKIRQRKSSPEPPKIQIFNNIGAMNS